ncbi:hypothetical protein MCOR27_009750 [Pyricularia oryzae]|nr:hypothetical protein MCOR01_009009 [Pyricularia oryzae]KAI6251778.1 hypothetical protein MCOR19_011587 [Pyricularia oryzae]KAI6269397.1 hypothetical protein MCOR27_009750 [Pyricularia oryzae]KAI6318118.1 hypothetical protein MCOR29_006030 [Pyricularia oryzae]KAI6412848.1 hypothetical protein MCOR20_003249 [Pyricularia oryzae]
MSRDEHYAKKASTLAAGRGRLRRLLPSITFVAVHYGYFVGVCIVSSLVLWASSGPDASSSSSDGAAAGRHGRVGYVDSLFLVVSAMTETGLNTVNLSELNTWQQTILFLLIVCGGSVWVSIWTVLARKWAFERRFDELVAAECAAAGVSPSPPGLLRRIASRLHTVSSGVEPGSLGRRDDAEGFGGVVLAGPSYSITRDTALSKSTSLTRRRRAGQGEAIAQMRADILQGVVDRQMRGGGGNRHVAKLTSEERCRLGGVEYRAIRLLAVVVPLYSALWQVLGCLALAAWIQVNLPHPPVNNGLSPIWLGIFNGASAFNNSGMSLLDANMVPFNQAYFVLATMGAMILAGNTAYPVFLRLVLWAALGLLRLASSDAVLPDLKAALAYALKHPRRVHPHLYPPRQTWWLAGSVVGLNAVMWVAFELLNLGNPIVESLPGAARVVDGLFQAIATRSGGFMVVPMAQVYIGMQVLYAIMMYIPVHPVSIKKPIVYQARRDVVLGIHSEGEKTSPPTLGLEQEDAHGESTRAFLSRQLKASRVGRHDAWVLVAAVLVITTIETGHFLGDPVTWSVWNVLFEVVSAYGCVGVSTGVPFDSFSFSGGWNAPSKLVLCLVMLKGRHRGLPESVYRAVVLPGEEEDVEGVE